ncbi:MAG: carboxypeptidase regulatory-like domain-containing protein, partial [Candidatus Micrarchaeota archaeon]
TVLLEPTDETNSGTVKVLVFDKQEVPVQGASVELKDELTERSLGIPARKTGFDGTQVFDGVPIASVFAVASEGVRSARSGSEYVVPSESNDTIEFTSLVVNFPLLKGLLKVTVRDAFSKDLVSNAVVSIQTANENFSCTTSQGICTANVEETEGAKVFVTASGYADFESSQFAVIPNTRNSREFELVPVAGPQARTTPLVFLGLFDMQGKKVSSTLPFSKYTAKYVLSSPAGLDYDKATAFVSVGGLTKSVEQEQAFISSFDAYGAKVTKGVDFKQAEGFSPSENGLVLHQGEISITDNGFNPSRATIYAGDSVTWRNDGAEKHSVISDRTGFASNVLDPGSTYQRVFAQAGTYYYHNGFDASKTGVIEVKQKEDSAVESVESAAEYKWVEFEFSKFTGSREIQVQIQTRGVNNEFSLRHRNSFEAAGIVLRQPVDDQAGVSKSPLLAETVESGSFEINYQGICQGEICLKYYFNSGGDKVQQGFEAEYDSEFSLDFDVFARDNSVVTVSTSSPALEIQRGVSGSSAAEPSVSGSGQTVSLQMATAAQTVSGSVQFKAIDLAEDAGIVLKVQSGSQSIERELFLRVFTRQAPRLIVSVTPDSLTALEDASLLFRVRDSLDRAVENIDVRLEGEPLGSEVLQASAGPSGSFEFSSLSLGKPGSLDYEVSAPGYRTVTGVITVDPPYSFIEFSPESISLTGVGSSYDASEEASEVASQEFVLTNKLDASVDVGLSLLLDEESDLSDIYLSSNSLSFDRAAEQSASIDASLRSDLLAIAMQPETIEETVSGVLYVRASAGSVIQEFEIPVTVSSSFTQSGFEGSWTVDSNKLSFNLVSPGTPSAEQEFRVSNQGPYPILVNVESGSQLVSFSPLSQLVSPDDSVSFTVQADIPDSVLDDCFAEPESDSSKLKIVASAQGFSTSQNLPVDVAITQAESCIPAVGARVKLPFNAVFSLPYLPVSKRNADGSTALKLPSGEVILFEPGSSFYEAEVRVPMDTGVRLPPQYVQSVSGFSTQSTLTVSFPLDVKISIPQASQVFNDRGAMKILTSENEITMPPSARMINEGSGSYLMVPANSPISFGPNLHNPFQFLPFNPVEVVFPVAMQLEFQPGSQVISFQQDSQTYYALPQTTDLEIVQMPDGSRIAFGENVRVGTSGNVLQASLNQQAHAFLPSNFVEFLDSRPTATGEWDSSSFKVILPARVSISFPVIAAQGFEDPESGRYTLKIANDIALQFDNEVEPRQDGSTAVLQLQPFTPIYFIQGARAQALSDPSLLSSCSQEFTSNRAVLFTVPAGTTITQSGSETKAILPSCSSSGRLTFYSDSISQKTMLITPVVKELSINGPVTISGDLSSTSSSRIIHIPEGTAVSMRRCKLDSERRELSSTDKQMTFFASGDTNVILPPSASFQGSSDARGLIDLNGVREVKIQQHLESTNSYLVYTLGRTRQVSYDSSSGLTSRIIRDGDASNQWLQLPEGASISFEPYCDEATGAPLEVMIVDSRVGFDVTSLDFGLGFRLGASTSRDEKSFCVYNEGSAAAVITELEFIPDATDDLTRERLNQIFDTDTSHVAFGLFRDNQNPVNMQIAPRTTCSGGSGVNTLSIAASLQPDGDLLNADGCYTGFTGSGVFKFYMSQVQPNFPLVPQEVAVNVVVETGGPAGCPGATVDGEPVNSPEELPREVDEPSYAFTGFSEGEHNGLTGIEEFLPPSVGDLGSNVLAFDAVDHVRPLAITNNMDYDADVIVTFASPHLECVSSEDDDKELDGLLLRKGESAVLLCHPLALPAPEEESSGTMTVTFTPRNAPGIDAQTSEVSYHVAAGGSQQPEGLGYSYGRLAGLRGEQDLYCLDSNGNNLCDSIVLNPAQKAVYYKTCFNYFCTYAQALEAYDSFLWDSVSRLDYFLRDETQRTLFINRYSDASGPGTGTLWEKSTIIFLTNTVVTPEERFETLNALTERRTFQYNEVLNQQPAERDFQAAYGFRVMEGNADMVGCGAFKLTVRLLPGTTFSGPVAPENVQLQISIDKVAGADCPVNVANLGLLTAEEPLLHVGNRMPESFFEENSWADVGSSVWTLISGLSSGRVFQGELLQTLLEMRTLRMGPYSNEVNEFDKETVNIVFPAL